jgi:hypothetical protein
MKHNAIKGNAYLALALVLAITTLTGCPGLFLDTGGTQSVDSSKLDLSYKALVEKAYVGGSVIYALQSDNKTPAPVNHLAEDVVIPVRLGRVVLEKNSVEYEESMESPIFSEDPNSPISYGYIKITSVGKDAVTFSYQRFSTTGGLPFGAETFTVRYDGAAADINHDGAEDIAYGELDVYRPGLGEDSRYLNFISSNINLNTTMYSVDPGQYVTSGNPRGNYPGGLVGINPNGKWLVNKYAASEAVMLPQAERDTTTGALNQVQGLIKGDFIIENSFSNGGYYYYQGGDLDLSTRQPADNLTPYLERLGGHNIEAMSSSAGSSFSLGGNLRAAVGSGGGVDEAPLSKEVSSAESDKALAGIVGFIKADIPLFITAEAADARFIDFKKKLLAVFPTGYTPPTPASAYNPQSATIEEVVAFLNAVIQGPDLGAVFAPELGSPAALSAVMKAAINRGILLEKFRETGLNKYILPVNMDTGDVTDALPIMAFELKAGFDYDYDPNFEWEGPGGGANAIPDKLPPTGKMTPVAPTDPVDENIVPPQAAAGYVPEARAVKDYTTYVAERESARSTFDTEFTTILERDVANTILNAIGSQVTVENVVTTVALGLAGGGTNVWGHASLTVGAAVYLQMEVSLAVDVTLSDLLGDDGLLVFNYANYILIGGVVLTVDVPVYVNLDINLQGSSNRTYFAGYTGFYGGKGTAGLRYGVNYSRTCVWPWPKAYVDVPTGYYADPYSSGESWSTTIAYAGPKSDFGPVSVSVSATITPRVIVKPRVTGFGMIYVMLPVEVQLPLGVAIQINPFGWTLTGQLNFLVNFEAGIGIRILIWDLSKGLVNIRLATVNIPLFSISGGATTRSPGFRSYHGKYASAQPDGTVVADRAAKGAWETWMLEDRGGGKVALKSAHGYYLSAQENGTVVANRTGVGTWETWTMTELGDNRVQFKSYHGKYLQATAAGVMNATAASPSSWETWVSVQ